MGGVWARPAPTPLEQRNRQYNNVECLPRLPACLPACLQMKNIHR